jgi:hypothetical protein
MLMRPHLLMRRLSVLCLGLVFITLGLTGCGGSESTVVQPGADYQLTPDEERMKAEIDAVPPPENEGR